MSNSNNPEIDPTKFKINMSISHNLKAILNFLKDVISFNKGVDINETTTSIRDNVEFKGTLVWVLMCSIVVASVGLNTNSTAVIIGAMLISPLMGPIRGIGLGVGTNDLELIFDSLKNFGIAVGISLFTAWIFFLITPISELTAELEARTGPNLMDVFIAFFGGLAGIIAATRGDDSTVIPGVAIATALMPPLCTAGYGLAVGNMSFFIGASYLFLLNTLFICLSTIVVVRYLKFPVKTFINPSTQKRVSRITYFILFLIVLPSVYLFYIKVKETIYHENVKQFVQEVVLSDPTLRVEFISEYDSDSSKFELWIKNKVISESKMENWRDQMKNYDLDSQSLIIFQGDDLESKLALFKKDLASESMGKENLIQEKENKINYLEDQIFNLNDRINQFKQKELDISSLRKNIKLHFNEVDTFEFYSGISSNLENEIDSVYSLAVKYKPQVSDQRQIQLNEKIRKQLEIYLEDKRIKGYSIKVFNYK